MSENINLFVDQGTTWSKAILIKGADGKPFNLGGYTPEMMVRRHTEGGVVLHLTTDNGKITLGGGGLITLSLTPSDTSAVFFEGERAMFPYDLEITDGSTVRRLMQGILTLSREITR